jgi:hypothetical protein
MNPELERIYGRWKAAGSPVVKAAGTSEGVRKSWETRKHGTYNGVDVELGKQAFIGKDGVHSYIADAHGVRDDDMEGSETNKDPNGGTVAVAMTHVHPSTSVKTRLALFKHPQTGEWHVPLHHSESEKVWDYKLRN